VGAGEQGVLPVESKRTDGAFDGVVAEIDSAIVEKADQTVPAGQRVADRLPEGAIGADLPAACFKEPVEVIDDRRLR
jgi:hypothetical protein